MLRRVLRRIGQLVSPGDPSARLPPAGATPLEPLASLGRVVVFAPHPDDETLGCGGLLALLKDAGSSVHVVVVSDGGASHPNSRRYPRPKLAALRESEARAAVAKLGLDPASELEFLGLRDGGVPDGRAPDGEVLGEADTTAFAAAVDAVAARLTRWKIDTVVGPLRADAHADHRASFRIIDAALNMMQRRPRLLEYGIWGTPGRAGIAVDPQQTPYRDYYVDVSRVLRRKRAAIACHRSQATGLIDDDPTGFRLSPRVIAHFSTRWESFHEAYGDAATGIRTPAEGTGAPAERPGQ